MNNRKSTIIGISAILTLTIPTCWMMLCVAVTPLVNGGFSFDEDWLFCLHTAVMMICLGLAIAIVYGISKFWIGYRALAALCALAASALGAKEALDPSVMVAWSFMAWLGMSVALVIGPLLSVAAMLKLEDKGGKNQVVNRS